MNTKLMSVLFALSLIFNVLFFLFAYVQKAAADDALQQAIVNEKRAVQNEMKAQQAMMEAERQAQKTVICMQELEARK